MQTDVVRKKQFDIKDNVKFNGNVLKSKAFVSKNIFIIIMVLGCMMGSFSHTAFSSMLENIMKEFNLSASKSQLMTAVYSMTIGVTTILSVFLTKYFDKKKLFFSSMLIFGFGIILSAVSVNYGLVIIGRVFQALGSGVVLILSQVILLSAFSKEKTGVVMGIYGFLLNLSSAAAPVVTLLLVKNMPWQFIMWGICLGVIVILSVQIWLYVLEKRKCEKEQKNKAKKQEIKESIIEVGKKIKKFDFTSFVLSGFSVIFFMAGFTLFKEMKNSSSNSLIKSILFVLAGVVFIVVFIVRQKQKKKPYINLKLFKNKNFVIVVISSIIIYAVMMGTAVWFPVYIKRIAEADMERVGIIMLPGALSTALASAVGGWLYQKYGIRLIYSISICSFILAILTRNIVPLWVLFVLRSIGIGIIMMSMVAWGMKDIEKDKYSDGTAIICSLRTVAGAFGTALAAMLM